MTSTPEPSIRRRSLTLVLIFAWAVLVPAGTAHAADPWKGVGASLNSNTATAATDPAATTIGTTPYVAWAENSVIYVKSWNGTSWTLLGTNVSGAQTASTPELANDGTYPWVAHAAINGSVTNIYVKRWDGTSWLAVGGSLNISTAAAATNPRIVISGGVPSVTWLENNNIYAKQWNGASWASLGGIVEPTTANQAAYPSIAANGATTYVGLMEWNGSKWQGFVRSWNGTSWSTLGGAAINISTAQNAWRPRVVYDGAPLVLWAEDTGVSRLLRVKRWTGSAWVIDGTTVNEDFAIDEHEFYAVGGTRMVLWTVPETSASYYQTRVSTWNGSDWIEQGGSSNVDHYLSSRVSALTAVSGEPWVALQQATATVNQVMVRQFVPPTTTDPGPISGLTVTPGSGSIALAWTNPPDVDFAGVRIYRSTTAGSQGALVKTVLAADVPNNSWTDSAVTNQTTYFYTLSAFNSAGEVRGTAYETATGQLRVTRYGSGVASDGTKAWIFGGCSTSNCTLSNAIVEYDPATDAFTTKAATLPTGRSQPRVAWAPNASRVVVMGGWNGSAALAAIHEYDPATDTLTTPAATLPAARSWGAAAYAPNTGRVYYLGGSTSSYLGGTLQNTIYWYDPVSDTSGTTGVTLPQPMARMFAVYWPATGCIYMFGGVTTGDVASNRIVRYCPLAGSATNMTTVLPTAQMEVTASATDREIVLLGEFDGSVYGGSVRMYDPVEDALVTSPVRTSEPKAFQSASVSIAGSIYGFTPFTHSLKASRYVWSTTIDATPSLPSATPVNVAPGSGAVVATGTPTLSASAFNDPNVGDVQSAEQWRVRTDAGTYASPAWDSGIVRTGTFTSEVVSPALPDSAYWFQVRYRDDNRVWSAWSTETRFTIDTVPDNPESPTTLQQLRNDGVTTIATTTWTSDGITNNITFKFLVADKDAAATLTPWVEIRPNSTGFSGTCGTAVSGAVVSGAAVTPSAPLTWTQATVTITGLTSGTQYHWRACSRDETGRSSPWVSMGASPDFGVIVNAAPTAPALVSPADGATWADTTPDLVATFADPDVGQTGQLEFEVCTVVAVPAQTCAAAGGTIAAAGTSPAGIAIGSPGTWTSTVLALATYGWRARGIDQYGFVGPWANARTLVIGTPTMTIAVDAATVDLGSFAPGVDAAATSVVTLTTNNATGYQLDVVDADDAWGMRKAPSTDIPDWTGTNATPSTWAAGSPGTSGWFGLTVLGVAGATSVKDAKWGTGSTSTDYVNNRYAGLKTTVTVLHVRPGYFAPADTVTTAYRVIAAATTPAGTYSTTLTYTATANP